MNKIMSIEEMKQFSQSIDKDEERELLSIYNNKLGDYNFGVVKNYNETQKKYEVYLFIEYENGIVSPLLIKYFVDSRLLPSIYYNNLKKIINKNNKDEIMEEISSMLIKG